MKTSTTTKTNEKATTNAANAKVQNDVITVKALAAIKKDTSKYRDSFKNACLTLLEIANGNSYESAKDCKRVCQYLGITAEGLKPKVVSETRKNVLDKLPLYYTVAGSETHFPARLQKINKNANINAYIAVKDSYINALLSLAKILSTACSYDIRKVDLTIAETDGDTKEYTAETVIFAAYDKEGKSVEADKAQYIEYLNRNRIANQVASEAKAAYLSK